MKPYKLVCIILLGVILSGCASVKEYLDIARDGTVSQEYLQTLHAWTREQTAYSNFETRARIIATLRSKQFNQAYLSEYSRIYLLTGSEKKQKEDLSVDFESDFVEFLFYAYTPDREESNDFSREKSLWKIVLIDHDGKRFEPLEIREIEPVTPLIKEFFPYVKPAYGKVYSLKFVPEVRNSKGDLSDVKLLFTGVLARVELTWLNR